MSDHLSANPAARGNHLFHGIAFMVSAVTVFAMQDAITKHLALSYPAPFFLMIRYWAFALFAAGLAVRAKQPTLDIAVARAPYQQIARALLLYFAMIVFALGVRELKLADTHAVLAVMPLIVTALSAPMLGERVGWRRWLAVTVGFAGVLVILRPGIGVFQPAAIYPIVCAVMLALYTVLTRRVSRHDSFLTTFFYTGVVGAAAATSIGFFYWSEPSYSDWAFIGALCITSILGHFLLIRALELAPAAVLQSFHYLILVWAIILGFVFFDELPDAITIAGGAVVVSSGLFVVWREHSAAQKRARD